MVLISPVPVFTLLYFYNSTFRSMCAVPNMAVFWSSLTSYFPGMLLTYFLNDSEIVPVAPIITGITFVFTFHMRCVSIVRSLYFRIFSASLLLLLLLLYKTCLTSRNSLLCHSVYFGFCIILQGTWVLSLKGVNWQDLFAVYCDVETGFNAKCSSYIQNFSIISKHAHSHRYIAINRLLGLQVRIPPGEWMSVSCECCVLSGRADHRLEESYRLWCVTECVREASVMRRSGPLTISEEYSR